MKEPTNQRERDMLVLSAILSGHTREELRALAKSLDVRRGRNKSDTINNIVHSGKTNELRIVLR